MVTGRSGGGGEGGKEVLVPLFELGGRDPLSFQKNKQQLTIGFF